MHSEPLKLHLGCGERYLEGYVNVDYPPEDHSVQCTSVADVHRDILTLVYPPESVNEVRLHHVFEHFPRQTACALLATWNRWLVMGGTLHIEVPDFTRTARVMLKRFRPLKEKLVAERHIFGTHESFWARHCEGWSEKSLEYFLNGFGFAGTVVTRNEWRGTYNFEMIAQKERTFSREEFARIAEDRLKLYLLDDSDTEMRLLGVWLNEFNKFLDLNF